MKYARIQDGIVAEIIDAGSNDINGMFHADIVTSLVECDNTVTEHMTYDGGVFALQVVEEYIPTPKDEIIRLEAIISPRRIREAILGTDGGWLAAQEALIAAERQEL